MLTILIDTTLGKSLTEIFTLWVSNNRYIILVKCRFLGGDSSNALFSLVAGDLDKWAVSRATD